MSEITWYKRAGWVLEHEQFYLVIPHENLEFEAITDLHREWRSLYEPGPSLTQFLSERGWEVVAKVSRGTNPLGYTYTVESHLLEYIHHEQSTTLL